MNSTDRRALEGNIRRFVVFRLLYSSRFYYPVFTVMFLDYGLSLAQFSLLNAVWAITILLAEVPSGALADVLGRKKLVVSGAAIMVLELSLIVFSPLASANLLFAMLLGNRICSGLSEAAASGADEALAYDSLRALGREAQWSRVLERTAMVVAMGTSAAMIIGGLAYDPAIVNGLLQMFVPGLLLADTDIIRLPAALTLLAAIACLLVSLGMKEPPMTRNRTVAPRPGPASLAAAFRRIADAGRWTLNHRFILFVILAALALDSVAREFVVLSSEYWRLIDIPVPWFGVIAAALALMGIVTARLSRYLVHAWSPLANFLLLALVLGGALLGLSLAIPRWGLLFAPGAFAMMSMVQFQSSYYINHQVGSDLRATVLSFRGLALNLGFALVSAFYAGWVALLAGERSSQQLLADSLMALPLYFGLLFITIVLAARLLLRSPRQTFRQF